MILLLLLMGATPTTAEVSVSFFTAEDSLIRDENRSHFPFLSYIPVEYVRECCNQVFKRRLKESILPACVACGEPMRQPYSYSFPSSPHRFYKITAQMYETFFAILKTSQ